MDFKKSCGERRCSVGRNIASRRFVPVRHLRGTRGNLNALLVAVAAPAVKTGAKDRHQRDDVAGELLFESFLRAIFENVDFSAHSTANLPNQADAKPQKPILMYDGKLLHASVEQLSQQRTKTGLAAVEPGADILYHFLASGLAQTRGLSGQILLLIVGRSRERSRYAFSLKLVQKTLRSAHQSGDDRRTFCRRSGCSRVSPNVEWYWATLRSVWQ